MYCLNSQGWDSPSEHRCQKPDIQPAILTSNQGSYYLELSASITAKWPAFGNPHFNPQCTSSAFSHQLLKVKPQIHKYCSHKCPQRPLSSNLSSYV